MRRIKYLHPEKELKKSFSIEWRRAKKLLAPALDDERKPLLYTAKKLKRWKGFHSGGERTIAFKVNGRWVNGTHKIVLLESLDAEQMVKTIRHEICHVVHQNHKTKFWSLFHQLTK